LRIAFNPNDANYMATFHLDSADVQMLDMRSPGQPVAELRAHQGEINAIGWGKSDSHLLSSAGKFHFYAFKYMRISCPFPRIGRSTARLGPLTFEPLLEKRHQSRSSRSERKGSKNIITDPILAYSVPGELCNLAWSPPMPAFSVMGAHVQGGDWIATATGKSLRCLKV
jgi:WD repeat-containing protein 68